MNKNMNWGDAPWHVRHRKLTMLIWYFMVFVAGLWTDTILRWLLR